MNQGNNIPSDGPNEGHKNPPYVQKSGEEVAPGAGTPACIGGLVHPPSVGIAHPKIESLKAFPLAKWHLDKYPFRAPAHAHQCVAWYEGSFNPMHEGHAYIVQRLLEMGFGTVVVGTVPKNPHKDPSTFLPFELRVEAVKEQFRDMGFKLAENSKEPGVFVTATADSFQDERLRAWYRDNWYVVMGPDNFQSYYGENRAWALFAAKDEEMKDFTRFKRLYETFLKDRILVNDEEYAHHAENIRRGEVGMLPSVERVMGNLVREMQSRKRPH